MKGCPHQRHLHPLPIQNIINVGPSTPHKNQISESDFYITLKDSWAYGSLSLF